MAFVATDWSIDRQTKNVRYTGSDHNGVTPVPSYATVLEFHRALQDFADDASYASNDEIDITDPTPTEKQFDTIITLQNGYNIDDLAAEHLYDGSIIQDSGNVIYDGIQVLAPISTAVQFIQNGAVLADDFWNYSEGGTHTGGLNAAILTDTAQAWTVNEWVGFRIQNTTDGSYAIITANTATTITGTLLGGTGNDWDTSDVYLIQSGLNADASNGIAHKFILKVRTGGADIDGRRLVATTREWGNNFLEFKVNGTSRGINVVALSTASDLNNTTNITTVAGLTAITNITQGYNGIDVNNDTVNEFFYSKWNRDVQTINTFYERMKWLSRDGSTSTLYGLNGELFRGITHEIVVDTPLLTFNAFESVSWNTTVVGTGQMLAINSPTAGTKMWIQLLTGVAPTNNDKIIGGTSGASVLVNATTITTRTVSTPFVGASTGSAIIGAFGFGVETADLSKNDKVFDLSNVQFSPPNFVVFTVGGIISGDRVLVGPAGYRFAYDAETNGPFVVGDTVTFATPAGTAVLAELVDSGTTGYMVIGPMLTGSTPTDNTTIAGATATAIVNGTVSNAIDTRQFTISPALTTATTAVVVAETIPADTPNTGTIRIQRTTGTYSRHAYDSWTGSTFTLSASGNFNVTNAALNANAFLSYIDVATTTTSETFTGVYASDRSLFIRVRDGGASPIKTFETTGTLTNSGGSTTAIRTSDA